MNIALYLPRYLCTYMYTSTFESLFVRTKIRLYKKYSPGHIPLILKKSSGFIRGSHHLHPFWTPQSMPDGLPDCLPAGIDRDPILTQNNGKHQVL